jgi:hypothetical protein
MRMANRSEELTDKKLKDVWAVAPSATKENVEQNALQLLQRGPFLIEEITN